MSAAPESTRLLDALRQTAEALEEHGVPWALVGGLAVSIRVEPRFTRDIDIAVAVPDDAAAESVVSNLQARGFTLHLSLEQQALGRLAAVRMLPPGGPQEGTVVDLLFSSSGVEPEICRDAERIEIAPGLVVPVATVGHLVAMKLLALSPSRPQDAVDLRGLRGQLTPDDQARAVAAVTSIEARGAHRGKGLRAEFDRWLDER